MEKKCIKITPFIVNSNIYIIMHQVEFCFRLNINFTFSFPMNVYEIQKKEKYYRFQTNNLASSLDRMINILSCLSVCYDT